MSVTIHSQVWPIIWNWLAERHGQPIEDTIHVPTELAIRFAELIRTAGPLDLPQIPGANSKSWTALADFFAEGFFTIRQEGDRVTLDDSPIISGPPLPEKSSWKYRQDIEAAERERENRRARIRLAPRDGLTKLLELPQWRGARLDGRPTEEDLALIRRDIERAKVALASATWSARPRRELDLAEEEARLRRAEDPRAQRFLHPSGAVLIWLPVH